MLRSVVPTINLIRCGRERSSSSDRSFWKELRFDLHLGTRRGEQKAFQDGLRDLNEHGVCEGQ